MSFQPPQQPGQPDYGAQQPPPAGPPPGGYAPPPPPPPGYSQPPPPPPGYAPPPPAGYAPPPPPPGYAQPPGYSQPPPAYGQPAYGAPAHKSGVSFDPASVNPMDWAILGVAFLAFIFSLFDYYTVTVSFGGGLGGGSASASAWHGFFGWAAVLLALIAAAIVAIELFVPQVSLPFPGRLVSLGVWAAATLFVVLALFIFPYGNYDGPGIDEGRGFGYWADLVLIIAGVVLSVLRLKATGGKLPWEKGPSTGPPGPGAGYGGGMPPQAPPMPPQQLPPPPGGYPQQ